MLACACSTLKHVQRMRRGLHCQHSRHARRQGHDVTSAVAGRCIELAVSSCAIAPRSRITDAMNEEVCGSAPSATHKDRARPQPGSVGMPALLACFVERRPLERLHQSVAVLLSCGARPPAAVGLVNEVRMSEETCTGGRLWHLPLTLPGPTDGAPLLRACRLFSPHVLCHGGGAALLAEALHGVLDEDSTRA